MTDHKTFTKRLAIHKRLIVTATRSALPLHAIDFHIAAASSTDSILYREIAADLLAAAGSPARAKFRRLRLTPTRAAG